MGEKTDQVKGTMKEAVGVLTGDKDLEAEGKADRRTGEGKEKLADVKDEVEAGIETAGNKIEEGIDKVKDAVDRK